jgi:tetratricopeptide (TPR) repeat protein
MPYPLLLLFIGFLYIILFGVLTWMRREALSPRSALEAIIFTLLVLGLVLLTGIEFNPAYFLVVLYFFTLRARLLADLATMFAMNRKFNTAASIFNLALRLWPDPVSRQIVRLNQGVMQMQSGAVDEAIAIFNDVLEHKEYLGSRHRGAACYNLGMAYLKKNQESRALTALAQAAEASPTSEYGRRAEAYLNKRKK